MSISLEIQIEEPFDGQVQEDWLRQAAETVLTVESIDYLSELSLLITGDNTIRKLNRVYRKIDQTTDVLAFAFLEDVEGSSFPPSPNGIAHLGEVIISCPQAMRQADEEKHSLKDELVLLVVHGVLHLLGYDHANLQDERIMRARESDIVARLNQ